MHNWRRYTSSNSYEIHPKRGSKFGALLWCHLMPQRKSQYRCTTTIHPVYKCSKRFWKIYFLRHGAHKLRHSEPFLGYRYEIWHLLSALLATCWKIFYIGAHLHTRPETTAVDFFKSLNYLHEVVRTNLSADFLNFRNFWPPFLGICGATYQPKWELCSASERSLVKKRRKPCRNRPINGNATLVRTKHPSNARCSGLGAWQSKKL